jgi:hypothetical protein
VEEEIRKWAAEEGAEKGLAYSESFKVMLLVKEEKRY